MSKNTAHATNTHAAKVSASIRHALSVQRQLLVVDLAQAEADLAVSPDATCGPNTPQFVRDSRLRFDNARVAECTARLDAIDRLLSPAAVDLLVKVSLVGDRGEQLLAMRDLAKSSISPYDPVHSTVKWLNKSRSEAVRRITGALGTFREELISLQIAMVDETGSLWFAIPGEQRTIEIVFDSWDCGRPVTARTWQYVLTYSADPDRFIGCRSLDEAFDEAAYIDEGGHGPVSIFRGNAIIRDSGRPTL
jgi:hypothetical protein